ncbi:MAG: DNA sulfur modification protein DndD [Cenarchaeum symbiont of Oopsacas minuta]|nr:DNA sulfur modification protein DndD [Cenarchaeum symbiont of Oopsacas minuta]
MLLARIILDNIGVYKGSHEFDLETTPQKPIILYGGVNGAGKTTLFESIPLCLYGQRYVEDKITKKEYHQKIRRLFHRNAKTSTSAKDASITLEFQYAQNGKITQYQITRIWQNNDGRVDEFLKIFAKPIGSKKYSMIDSEESQLQHMINQMMPKSVTDLFFFDGERIQNLAKFGNENVHIKSSFDDLLGLNTSRQLHDDIGLYLLRNSDGADAQALADLERVNQDKNEAQNKLESLQEKRVFLNGEISNKNRDLQLKEAQFFKLGGIFAKNRQKLVDEKIELDRHIANNEIILSNLVEKNLPFAIVKDQLKQIKSELQSDISKLGESFEKSTLNGAFDYMTEKLNSFLNSYTPEIKKEILQHLYKISDEKLKSLSGKQQMTFDFSLSEMKIMQDRIQTILDEKYESVHSNNDKHKNILEKQKEISIKLDVAPQQDEIGPLYSDIKETTLEIGEMEQELQAITNMESQEKSMIVLLNSKIRKQLSKRKIDQRKNRGMDMIPVIQEVLNDYSQRLRTKKIKILESNIFEGIKKCFHKDGLISNISINPETYNVTLYRENGNEILREELSKGELQMYATAIIWGLAKTSGRSLPFVIDTPLARLDEQHRENLIRNFYPAASHQTIIFSTDAEIVNSYYELLKPSISKSGVIRYDETRDCSFVDTAYFEKRGDLVAV